ncbi:MAG: insulinase family protein [Candidatus Rokubacteria bacterium]|nr:insulinase family protein [Candidatus Rokubacteria bacterium]
MKIQAAVLVSLVLSWPIRPVAAQPAPVARIARHVLGNGLTVLVRENPAAAVVAVSLQIRGGSGFETAETAGITNFLQRAMLRGTTRYGARELIEAAQDLGGTVDASADVEYAEIRASGLARHWDRLLELVAEVALAPTLPSDEIERERRLILSQIQTREDNPFPHALETLMSDLYGPHPYGLPVLGRRAGISRLGREQLLAHYRAIYRPDRMVIAVSGQVDPARATRLVERLFGRVAATTTAGFVAPPHAAPAARRRVLERPARKSWWGTSRRVSRIRTTRRPKSSPPSWAVACRDVSSWSSVTTAGSRTRSGRSTRRGRGPVTS